MFNQKEIDEYTNEKMYNKDGVSIKQGWVVYFIPRN